jgi:hypothetical protein
MLLDLPEVPEIPEVPDFDASKFTMLMNSFIKAADRGEPFNPNSVSDLKQTLMIAVSSYRVQNHYSDSVNDRIRNDSAKNTILELLSSTDYDYESDADSEGEDDEDSESATWEDVLGAIEEIQAFEKKYAHNLAKALTAFEKLSKTFGEHLSILLKVILTAPNDVQYAILGNAYFISPEIIDDTIDGLLAVTDDRKPYATMEDSLKAFIKTLNKKLAHLSLSAK